MDPVYTFAILMETHWHSTDQNIYGRDQRMSHHMFMDEIHLYRILDLYKYSLLDEVQTLALHIINPSFAH